MRKKLNKFFNTLAYTGTSISALLIVTLFVLLPLTGLIGLCRLIAMLLGWG